jgi:NADH:flavin oxidoreductase / NADH oxidase family
VTERLFTPVQIGPVTLGHRIVMAPLPRSRSEQAGDISNIIFSARQKGGSSSQATTISISGRGWFGSPGLYADELIRVNTGNFKGRPSHVREEFFTRAEIISRVDIVLRDPNRDKQLAERLADVVPILAH